MQQGGASRRDMDTDTCHKPVGDKILENIIPDLESAIDWCDQMAYSYIALVNTFVKIDNIGKKYIYYEPSLNPQENFIGMTTKLLQDLQQHNTMSNENIISAIVEEFSPNLKNISQMKRIIWNKMAENKKVMQSFKQVGSYFNGIHRTFVVLFQIKELERHLNSTRDGMKSGWNVTDRIYYFYDATFDWMKDNYDWWNYMIVFNKQIVRRLLEYFIFFNVAGRIIELRLAGTSALTTIGKPLYCELNEFAGYWTIYKYFKPDSEFYLKLIDILNRRMVYGAKWNKEVRNTIDLILLGKSIDGETMPPNRGIYKPRVKNILKELTETNGNKTFDYSIDSDSLEHIAAEYIVKSK